jgi:exodeoxyribonuclease VIII
MDRKTMFLDMSFADYLDLPGVSQSSLKPMVDLSPAHYRHARDNPRPSTPSQSTGTFTHSLTLEPEALLEHYAVEPTEAFKRDARTAEGKVSKMPASTEAFKKMREDFRLANEGKQIVDQATYETVRDMSHAVWGHDGAAVHLQKASLRERVIHWKDTDTGLGCKGRCDAINTLDHVIVDLKTTADIHKFNLYKWHYDLQAAFYCDGYKAMTGQMPLFYMIVVEASPPYCVQAAVVGRVATIVGRKKYKAAMKRLRQCQEAGEWPGLVSPDEWTIPEWEIQKYL